MFKRVLGNKVKKETEIKFYMTVGADSFVLKDACVDKQYYFIFICISLRGVL